MKLVKTSLSTKHVMITKPLYPGAQLTADAGSGTPVASPSLFQLYFLMLTLKGEKSFQSVAVDYSLIIFALTDIFLEALPWMDIGREGLAGRRKTQNQRIGYLLLLAI